ncbi:MAG: precorrin-8X methylmutase [Desulfotomaculales bacterium]
MDFIKDPAVIEKRSMDIVEKLVAPFRRRFTPEEYFVLRRVIHATGDPALVDELVFHNRPVGAGVAALQRGATIVCDVGMVAAGIRVRLAGRNTIRVSTDEPAVADAAARRGVTRALAGMHRLGDALAGSVVAIGNSPTALFGLLELAATGVRPVLVIGVPVGFVGAREAKDALLATDLPAVVLRGTRGGSAVAAAVVNALAILAFQPDRGAG